MTATELLRRSSSEYGADMTDRDDRHEYLSPARPRVRGITSEEQFVDVVRRLLRRDGVGGVDYRLVAPFWRDEALAPRRLAERWESWSAYWDATQGRPATVGSPYNDEPAGVARAWRLGIATARYPRGVAHLLPARWAGGRERIQAILRLSPRLRGAYLLPLKTSDLRRLARLSGAFLRALLGTRLPVDAAGHVDWAAVAAAHARWLALPRGRLRAARVPARMWLSEGLAAALRGGFSNPRRPWWAGAKASERLREHRAERAETPGDPLADGSARAARLAILDRVVEARAQRASKLTAVRRAAACYLRLSAAKMGLPEAVLTRALCIARADQKEVRDARSHARMGVDPYAPGAAKARVRSLAMARREARRSALLARNDARRRALRAADGALVGWRTWCCQGDLLVSPSQRTKWATSELVADVSPAGDGARGQPGIHASWGRTRGDHREYGDRTSVMGRVRGYGAYVAGPEGWRAERVVIDRLVVGDLVTDRQVDGLAERYRVPVGRGRR